MILMLFQIGLPKVMSHKVLLDEANSIEAIDGSNYSECHISEDQELESKPSKPSKPRKGRGKGKNTKITGLTQRKDVVLKKVLRQIKAYYSNNFNEFVIYAERKINANDHQYYRDCLKQYIEEEFVTQDNEELVDVLENLINKNKH